jgi:hypothetical protein
VRAIAEHFGVPVDLLIAGEFAGMIPLLNQQSYLGAVLADPAWTLTPPADWNPPGQPDEGYDRIYHLGYRGWPAQPLPFETERTLALTWNLEDGPIPQIDLERAWITEENWPYPLEPEVAVGFTEAWFELKLGLLVSLAYARPGSCLQLTPHGTRWTTEASGVVAVVAYGWVGAAQVIHASAGFLGDCSALHVLAVALGKPVLLVEPMEARHNDIFYPLGKTGRVRLLTGNDHLPSFDARHCADALREMLR